MEIIQIDTKLVEVDPMQPRSIYEGIEELAESMRKEGYRHEEFAKIRKNPDKEGYFITVDGNRRTKAAHLAPLEKMWVCIKEYDNDADVFMDQLATFANRKNLRPIEQAHAYETAVKVHGKSIGQVASLFGVHAKLVADDIRLLKLPPVIQKSLDNRELPKTVAKALCDYPGNQVITAFKWAMKSPLNAGSMMKSLEAYDTHVKNSKGEEVPEPSLFKQVEKKADKTALDDARNAFKRLEKTVGKFATTWGVGEKSILFVTANRQKSKQLETMAREMIRQGETIIQNIKDEKTSRGEIHEPITLAVANG